MRLQQEVLNQFVRTGEKEEHAYKAIKKAQEKKIADYNKNSPRFHGQQREVAVEVDDAEREYNERLLRISQNFEDSIPAPKTEIDDATSFNTSINDRDSYLGTLKNEAQSNVSKPHARKS